MSVHLEGDQFLPDWPAFSQTDVEDAQTTGDSRPLLFEWYKWTGLVANRVASLDPSSPSYRNLPPVEVAVLRGLLNRCSRLMLAVLRLASLQKHAEAIRSLSRSICESAILVQWLCKNGSGEAFKQYLANGLDAELRLKGQIDENIRSRGGVVQAVEKRMLAAIAEQCSLAGLTEDDVRRTKPLPDLASILRSLGHEELTYVVTQRLGSHAVHGTWPDLLFHYLEVEDDQFVLTDNTVVPEGEDFLGSPIFVLEAVATFAPFVLLDAGLAAEIRQAAHDAITEIVRVHRFGSGDDYAAG